MFAGPCAVQRSGPGWCARNVETNAVVAMRDFESSTVTASFETNIATATGPVVSLHNCLTGDLVARLLTETPASMLALGRDLLVAATVAADRHELVCLFLGLDSLGLQLTVPVAGAVAALCVRNAGSSILIGFADGFVAEYCLDTVAPPVVRPVTLMNEPARVVCDDDAGGAIILTNTALSLWFPARSVDGQWREQRRCPPLPIRAGVLTAVIRRHAQWLVWADEARELGGRRAVCDGVRGAGVARGKLLVYRQNGKLGLMP